MRTAEALLHESFHKKLSNLVSIRKIFSPGFDTFNSPTIFAFWNPNVSWNSHHWSLDRAIYGFHYYAQITLYYMDLKIRQLDLKLFDPKFEIDQVVETNLARSEYLGQELLKNSKYFGEDGVEMIQWLTEMLQATSRE